MARSLHLALLSAFEGVSWRHWIYFLAPVGVFLVPIIFWANHTDSVTEDNDAVETKTVSTMLFFGGSLVGILNLLSQILVILAVQVREVGEQIRKVRKEKEEGRMRR